MNLLQQRGIDTVQIKPISSSLVITFDSNAISFEQLTDSLQFFGSIKISKQASVQLTGSSNAIDYSRLFSLVPPLVRLAFARVLQILGCKTILTMEC